MAKPVTVDLPHSLGTEEAKRRMQNGIGGLKNHIPGGAADVQSSWAGNRMLLSVRAMGQEVSGHLDVEDNKVRVELMLPPFLAMFDSAIQGVLRQQGSVLLEDKSKKG